MYVRQVARVASVGGERSVMTLCVCAQHNGRSRLARWFVVYRRPEAADMHMKVFE